jgi:hypothetical protein
VAKEKQFYSTRFSDVRWRPVELYTARKWSSDRLHSWLVAVRRGIQHQIGPLSAQYDVIAVDQRSHGKSQKLASEFGRQYDHVVCAGLESSVRYRKNGHDAMSVVDVKLKVYGVSGLRIADAKTEGKKRMTSLRKAELDERFPGLLKLVLAGKHR